MKKGKENLSDPYVVWYYKREQRIEAAKVVIAALFLVVCVCALLFGGNQPTQEQEPKRAAQTEMSKDGFLDSRAEAWGSAEEGVAYFVDSDGSQVFIPEKYRDNPQEWIERVRK